MPKTKVEVYDKDQLIYPFIESDHVTFTNGMKITEMLDQSISMPKVTHEDSSFKVGVGDQDVSSAIVDSSVAEMVIKGQTYQNILPEPSLRNKMIGKSMQRLNEGYDNIEVVDGVSKSAILTGQTLVNCVKIESYATTIWPLIKLENVLVQPNKKYIAILKHLPVDCQWAITNIGESQSTHVPYNKAMYSIFTSPSTTTVTLTLHINKGAQTDLTLEELQKVQPMIIEYIEGMENWDIPYFTGMQSVKMPVLKTVGKNLFNTNSFTGEFYPNNSYITVDFPPSDNNTFSLAYKRYSDATTSYVEFEVRVLPNKKYFFSYNRTSLNNDPNLSRRISMYAFVINNTKESLKYVKFPKKNGGGLITTPSNCTSLMIRMYTTQGSCLTAGDTITLSEIQLEEVTEGVKEASPFEPYKTNILTTPEDVVLRGVGDVKDELNLMTGEMIQRIGEIVLDGSDDEGYSKEITSSGIVRFNFSGNSNNITQKSKPHGQALCDKLITSNKDIDNLDYVKVHSNNGDFWIYQADKDLDVNTFKEKLKINPLTIKYQLATESIKTVDLSILDQNGGTQENLHSFANGHLQVSSGENSLLPFVQYEIPTKNSYHMDLMKTNTLYTMKAKSVSGTFTIDGITYNVNANGTFTSPSSMTDKLLIMSNKTNEEVMLLEGNVIDKTIPYFKGIKSAFEGEDKIEVLSTGKNLFDGAFEKGVIDANGNLGYTTTAIRTVNYISVKPNTSYHINLLNLESFESLRVIYVHEYDENLKVLGETQVGNRNIYTSKSATRFIKINTHATHDLPVDSKMIICENSTLDKQYEPYKSNNTKIPLLSPLRSLPNGVCNELIIDRLNHKAKLIQRVGIDDEVVSQLATPIITEIDLEGYPYVYKDGHIFLNSEIAPTTQITYSINQSQQIESANENLQRHEKEISHLQKLIAQYIQVEYESTLLSLKI